MSATTAPLRDLHEFHQRVTRLREQRDRGPRQIEAKKKLHAQRVESIDKAKADLKSVKVKSHEKETERKALDGRIAQLQTQINTAASNKEYTALVAERDATAKARGAVEDIILELLMVEEEKATAIHASEAEAARLQKELADLEKTTAEQNVVISQKLKDAEASLATSEAALPGDMRDVYRRLVERRGSDALACAADGTCTGCYTGITPQMQNQLLMNEIVQCKSCGRILYLADPAPAAAES